MAKLFLAGLLASLLLTSGCGSTPGDEGSRSKQTQSESAVGGSGVDPQVLDDVVDGAFPVPGPSMRRYMRVEAFLTNFVNTACGATRQIPLDETWDRYDQGEFPDLALIRAKGFTEKDRTGRLTGFRKGCNSRSKGNLVDRMPDWQAWEALAVNPWGDVVTSVEQDPSVVALKAPFAQCLRSGTKGTGMVISSVDPANKFLTQLNLAEYHGTVTTYDVRHRLPKLYARCGRAYFARTQKLLETKRPAMIERNRELLDKAAHELLAMGYVP